MNERLTLQQIEQGVGQCIKSAQEILHSANTLKGMESRRVSLSLYKLAAEELGKTVLMYRTLLLDTTDDRAWKKFWESFYSHKPKLLAGVAWWSADIFNLDSDVTHMTNFTVIINDPKVYKKYNLLILQETLCYFHDIGEYICNYFGLKNDSELEADLVLFRDSCIKNVGTNLAHQ